jgi:hypothetical protein
MDRKEIHSTIGGVCVYRKRVKKAQFFVQSISIHAGFVRYGHTTYHVLVEFDRLKMVERGEGIRWGASSDDLDVIIESLESFIKKPLSEWTNQAKIEFYDSEIVTDEHYESSWNVLMDKYQYGKLLLPKGLPFVLQSAVLETPSDIGRAIARSKYRRPPKRKNA